MGSHVGGRIRVEHMLGTPGHFGVDLGPPGGGYLVAGWPGSRTTFYRSASPLMMANLGSTHLRLWRLL